MRKLRPWHYILPPKTFEMAPCSCGNEDTQWSEWEGMLWCDPCQKDFVPEHAGIFDGPIQAHVCKMLGIIFDRVMIPSGRVEIFNLKTGDWSPMEPSNIRVTKSEDPRNTSGDGYTIEVGETCMGSAVSPNAAITVLNLMFPDGWEAQWNI